VYVYLSIYVYIYIYSSLYLCAVDYISIIQQSIYICISITIRASRSSFLESFASLPAEYFKDLCDCADTCISVDANGYEQFTMHCNVTHIYIYIYIYMYGVSFFDTICTAPCLLTRGCSFGLVLGFAPCPILCPVEVFRCCTRWC